MHVSIQPNRRGVIIGAVVLVAILLWTASRVSVSSLHEKILDLHHYTAGHAAAEVEAIPNIIHYIWIHKPDSPNPLTFHFTDFLGIYAAHYALWPDQIYLHVDASPSVLEFAAGPDAPLWTKRIFALPFVTINTIKAPEFLEDRRPPKKIDPIQHRSDFVRPDILLKYGGVYLDFDVYPLKDITDIREMGYNTVIGEEPANGVNVGIIMGNKKSKMLRRWQDLMPKVYDGVWTTHSTILITKMVKATVLEQEILGLERQAKERTLLEASGETNFDRPDVPAPNERDVLLLPVKDLNGPTSWSQLDMKALYEVHPDTPSSLPKTIPPPDQKWMMIDETKREKWQTMNFTEAYMFHAYAIESSPGGEEVTLESVLRRQSIFARTLWPAAKDALLKGFLQWEDVEAGP